MTVKKVLVVDDSTTDLRNLEHICADAGYDVITACSGTEALSKTKDEQPDAILLDVLMSDMSGFQVCRAIANDAATRHIPVVLVSSQSETTGRNWGFRQGAKAYITKPFTPDQILGQLRQL
jgi:twitching motility two-component system response regulator PilH